MSDEPRPLTREDFLRWRNVDDPCLKCDGAGVRSYGSTATWRGGIGGQMITSDVCDACWGSGDRYRIGCDLRRLRSEERERIAKAAATALVDACGANFKSTGPQIHIIIEHLEKLVDGRVRGVRDVFVVGLAQGLANTLRRAIGAPERKV